MGYSHRRTRVERVARVQNLRDALKNRFDGFGYGMFLLVILAFTGAIVEGHGSAMGIFCGALMLAVLELRYRLYARREISSGRRSSDRDYRLPRSLRFRLPSSHCLTLALFLVFAGRRSLSHFIRFTVTAFFKNCSPKIKSLASTRRPATASPSTDLITIDIPPRGDCRTSAAVSALTPLKRRSLIISSLAASRTRRWQTSNGIGVRSRGGSLTAIPHEIARRTAPTLKRRRKPGQADGINHSCLGTLAAFTQPLRPAAE